MSKLAFILVDGLGRDVAFERMGFMEHLVETGLAARYSVKCELPSLSRPIYETLMTGVPVIRHGIVSNEVNRLSCQQNLFGLARENGLTTAAATYCWFSELYNKAPFDPAADRIQNNENAAIQHGIFYFYDTTGAYPDSHLVADAEYLRQTYNPDLLLVHPMNMDDMGHKYGGGSSEYARCASTIDYILSNAIPIWMQHGYSILLTADHGMSKWSFHGGNSASERLVPLYIVSPLVEATDYSQETVSQLMIAPLACKLLGIPRGEFMMEPVLPGLKG